MIKYNNVVLKNKYNLTVNQRVLGSSPRGGAKDKAFTEM